jgi:hypothetical protein
LTDLLFFRKEGRMRKRNEKGKEIGGKNQDKRLYERQKSIKVKLFVSVLK